MISRFSTIRRCLVSLISVAGFLTLHALVSTSQAAESQPSQKVNIGGGSGNSSGAGTVTPDLFTGTMSYSIPIEVPEGRKGMSPGLALNYKSSNGNGWVGVGWELEVGSIERSMKHGVNYDGDDFILRFAGGTVDLVNIGNYEYRARIEGEFLRIKRYPYGGQYGHGYWEVTDRSGVRYRYGYYAMTRLFDFWDSDHTFKWCLDQVEDANGNYMTISYTKTDQIYLERIDYTGHPSGVPTNHSVLFGLEPRDDAPEMYATGFKIKTEYRLKSITVLAKDSGGQDVTIRSYVLSYDAEPVFSLI